MHLKRLEIVFLLALGMMVCGCVSTYDQPLTTANYNRNHYVAPQHVHYYKDNYPNRNTRPNVSDNRYDYYGQYGSGNYGKPPAPPSNAAKPPAPPSGNYGYQNHATSPSGGQACRADKDCPSGWRCDGVTARKDGVCRR